MISNINNYYLPSISLVKDYFITSLTYLQQKISLVALGAIGLFVVSMAVIYRSYNNYKKNIDQSRLEASFLWKKEREKEREKKAAVEYEKILKINPQDIDALKHLVRYLNSQRKFDEIDVLWDRAVFNRKEILKTNPQDEEAKIDLIYFLNSQGINLREIVHKLFFEKNFEGAIIKSDESVVKFREVLKINPKNKLALWAMKLAFDRHVEILLNHVRNLVEEEKYEEALTKFEQAIDKIRELFTIGCYEDGYNTIIFLQMIIYAFTTYGIPLSKQKKYEEFVDKFIEVLKIGFSLKNYQLRIMFNELFAAGNPYNLSNKALAKIQEVLDTVDQLARNPSLNPNQQVS